MTYRGPFQPLLFCDSVNISHKEKAERESKLCHPGEE